MRMTLEKRGTEGTPTWNSDWTMLYITRVRIFLLVNFTGPHPLPLKAERVQEYM